MWCLDTYQPFFKEKDYIYWRRKELGLNIESKLSKCYIANDYIVKIVNYKSSLTDINISGQIWRNWVKKVQLVLDLKEKGCQVQFLGI